jgi:hypothetical protein
MRSVEAIPGMVEGEKGAWWGAPPHIQLWNIVKIW